MIVTFVCTGNTCRSPMLMFMMRQKLLKNSIFDVYCDSAGIMQQTKPLTQQTTQVLDVNCIEYADYYSKCIDKTLFEKSDLIFVMEQKQYEILASLYGANDKIMLLSHFNGGKDIFDPYGQGIEAYETLFKIFEGMLNKLTDYIMQNAITR